LVKGIVEEMGEGVIDKVQIEVGKVKVVVDSILEEKIEDLREGIVGNMGGGMEEGIVGNMGGGMEEGIVGNMGGGMEEGMDMIAHKNTILKHVKKPIVKKPKKKTEIAQDFIKS
jgi:hypothetical protein